MPRTTKAELQAEIDRLNNVNHGLTKQVEAIGQMYTAADEWRTRAQRAERHVVLLLDQLHAMRTEQ